MWERIAAGSVLMIGAIVLFILFTAALFILEKRNGDNPGNASPRQKPRSRQSQALLRPVAHKRTAATRQQCRPSIVHNPNRVA